jgi:uracil-DNA glycosylase
MFWEIISRLSAPVFTWNVFPYHPHEPGNPLSNRCHTPFERKECRSILLKLLELLHPTYVVAIGNDAELGLTDLGIDCAKVRHPSYGGKADFVAGMLALHPALSSVGASEGMQPALL